MEKRIVIVNGVELAVEEQTTASALKEQMVSSEEDQVFVKLASGKLYRLEDEAILPPDAEQVVIIPAFCWE